MADISKTQSVITYILEEVKAGRLTKGQRLPSCREIAKRLNLNKITVNKAYAMLEETHKVFSIPRGGFYLVESEDKPSQIENTIDFRTVKPDDKLIPYREFAHVINQAVDLYKNSLFGYESPSGLFSLRETLKEAFEKDGVYTHLNNILVTHGAQQAINLAFQAVFSNNKGKLLVEVPTYSLALKVAKQLNIDLIGIERTQNGYDFKAMESLFKTGDIVAFYVVPRHQNPTGYSLSEKEKKKIAELCSKYNILIIEDDYLADLGSKKGSMPIHYYAMSKDTVYIRSFSKTFMPGIRLGVAVLPQSLIEPVTTLKHLSDLNTSRLPQAALGLFIKAGMYEKHIRKVRKAYEAKLRKAKEILISLSPEDLIWHVPEYGIFIWLQLPNYIVAEALEKQLDNQGILIKAAGEFFLENAPEKSPTSNATPQNCIRLCISGVSDENISDIATILSVIRSYKPEQ